MHILQIAFKGFPFALIKLNTYILAINEMCVNSPYASILKLWFLLLTFSLAHLQYLTKKKQKNGKRYLLMGKYLVICAISCPSTYRISFLRRFCAVCSQRFSSAHLVFHSQSPFFFPPPPDIGHSLFCGFN